MKNPVPAKEVDLRKLENIYQSILRIYGLLDEHRWSQSLTNRDAMTIEQARKAALKAANDLYLATHVEQETANHAEPA